MQYRSDIDILRTFSVFCVILFHLNLLPNGYLGVDIFFVISGYLITGIIVNKVESNSFSLVEFYSRRAKRILPLVSVVIFVSLLFGIMTMLPDDLENLAQSIIATNLFNNNTLQILTTKNYWDVVNEYKPLMHTWSLAIEEQYYFLYPVIFYFSKNNLKIIKIILIISTLLSLFLFLMPIPDYLKFYLLPFRFFELSFGGVLSLFFKNKKYDNSILNILTIFAMFAVLFLKWSNEYLIILTVFVAGVFLITEKNLSILKLIMSNKILIYLGKISFGIYMWHQIVFAFARYTLYDSFDTFEITLLTALTLLLSVTSYHLIEKPMRYKVKTNIVFTILILSFVSSMIASFYLVQLNGVIRQVPELGIESNKEKKMHEEYNDKIYDYNKEFSGNKKLNILVIGDSFSRDWANILLESELSSCMEISYVYKLEDLDHIERRLDDASLVFVSDKLKKEVGLLSKVMDKTWCVGTKSFGESNGIFYNDPLKCDQYFKLNESTVDRNLRLKEDWGPKFINLMEYVEDNRGRVRVYTPDCKFISHDCRHLTTFGAKYFAELIDLQNLLFLNC